MAFLRYGVSVGVFAAAILSATTAFAGAFDSENRISDKQLSSFDSIYIAPVETDLDLNVVAFDRSGYGDRPVSADDAAARAAEFYDKLVDAFGKSFSLASAPGPGVLTLETTLTKLESTRPTLADYSRDTSLSSRTVYSGGAAMTAAFSEDGAPLVELSDSFKGNLNDGHPRSGLWEDAGRAFRYWAKHLAGYAKDN